MVAESLIARNKELSEKLVRIKFHSGELLNVMVEMSNDFTYQHDTHGNSTSGMSVSKPQAPVDKIGFSLVTDEDISGANIPNTEEARKTRQAQMRERAVPSTPIARMFGFGELAIRLAAGAASTKASQYINGSTSTSASSLLSDEGAELLAETLCRMRGAALKLGQMLSLQDDNILPPALSKALDRVKQTADFMPKRQLFAQLESQLGSNWRDHFTSFDEVPIAAASIGQVHQAVLKDGTTHHADWPSVAWQLLAYVVITAAEVLVSITCLEFSYTQAPKQMKSLIMGIYLLSVAAGNFLTAAVNRFTMDSAGNSTLVGANYYWFFTNLMIAATVLFIFVVIFYKPREYLQDGAD